MVARGKRVRRKVDISCSAPFAKITKTTPSGEESRSESRASSFRPRTVGTALERKLSAKLVKREISRPPYVRKASNLRPQPTATTWVLASLLMV